MSLFKATVELVVEADTASEAADGISETMRSLGPFVVDWQYQAQQTEAGERFLAPQLLANDPDTYEEGDAWSVEELFAEPLPDAHAEQFSNHWQSVGRPLTRQSLTSLYRQYVPDEENESIEWAYDDRHEFYFDDGSWALVTFKGRDSGYIQVGGLEDAEAHWDQQKAS